MPNRVRYCIYWCIRLAIVLAVFKAGGRDEGISSQAAGDCGLRLPLRICYKPGLGLLKIEDFEIVKYSFARYCRAQSIKILLRLEKRAPKE